MFDASKYVHLSYATQINKYTEECEEQKGKVFRLPQTYLFLSSSLIEGLLIQHHIIYFVDPANAIKFAAVPYINIFIGISTSLPHFYFSFCSLSTTEEKEKPFVCTGK